MIVILMHNVVALLLFETVGPRGGETWGLGGTVGNDGGGWEKLRRWIVFVSFVCFNINIAVRRRELSNGVSFVYCNM